MYDNVNEAVMKANLQAEVVKVEELNEIITRGVLITPSLFVDREEVVTGRVPAVHEIIDPEGGGIIAEQSPCSCPGGDISRIIFPCCGQADTGQITNAATIRLDEEGYCVSA